MSDVVKTFQSAIQNAASHKCKVQLPYPLDIPIPKETLAKAPKTFRVEVDYKKKLDECQCNAIYQQYSSQQLTQAMELGKLSKLVPRFALPPVNTNISYTTRVKPFSLTSNQVTEELNRAEKLPVYFNWADKSSAISEVYNQGMCGSCWAIAAASCLSDVFAIKNNTENPKLSPTYLLSCLPQSRCNGGDPNQAVEDIKKNGIGTMDCINENWCPPFSACGGNIALDFDPKTVNELIPNCEKEKCRQRYYISDARLICVQPDLSDFSPIERDFVMEYFSKVDNSVTGLHYKQVQAIIKRHIYLNGPVIGGFHVFNNFFRDDFSETNQIYIETQTYRGVPGIDYDDVTKSWAGSHAVVIVGWGKEKVQDEEVDYWIARNSWGVSWGTEGYFKIAMYGNDPDKKFQNRFAQFEYPSILVSDEGIGLTGGVILITPGKIEKMASPQLYTPSVDNKFVIKIALTVLILFLLSKIKMPWWVLLLLLIWML
jgi:C1A family cysteine protease